MGLTDPTADTSDLITYNVSGVPTNWTLSEGTNNGDGTWTITTSDPSSLIVTTASDYVGAMVLTVSYNWTGADGTLNNAIVLDNVEAYAPGSPIFAWSGDDTLTGSSASDLFVFAQPITHDTIYSFNAAADKIDLIGFAGFASFGDVQAHTVNDANGNAVLTLSNGETITLQGVDAATLSADNFVFNAEPVTTNTGTLTISDGAMMPFGGVIANSGNIVLDSTGSGTQLEVLVESVTLQGGGHVTLSDDSGNVIFGGTSSATLHNVDNTISGAGQLGGGQMSLINEGTIVADGSHALVIDTGSQTIANSGTLEAAGSGGLVAESSLSNSGLLWAHGADIIVMGDVSGSGTALIDGNGSIEFGGASSQNTSFAAVGDGLLKLDDSSAFTGTVSGFNAGDRIELADILDGPNTTLNFEANQAGAGGTLVVSDGTHTANIELSGLYAAEAFHLASNNHNGTIITTG